MAATAERYGGERRAVRRRWLGDMAETPERYGENGAHTAEMAEGHTR